MRMRRKCGRGYLPVAAGNSRMLAAPSQTPALPQLAGAGRGWLRVISSMAVVGKEFNRVVALRKRPIVPAEIVSDPSVMSGTRVQAETILTYLRAGHSSREIFEDYPSLPIDGIDAAIAWAEATYGPDWMGD